MIPAEVLIQDIPLLKTSFETVRKSRKEIAEIIPIDLEDASFISKPFGGYVFQKIKKGYFVVSLCFIILFRLVF